MSAESGKGRGRGRGRKGGGGRSRGRGGVQSAPQQSKRHKPYTATMAPKKGKAFSTPYEVPAQGAIGPFDLFCAVYLGILPDGSYRHSNAPNLVETARRLGRQPHELTAMLAAYRMAPEAVDQSEFDISLARLDIQVAPEGIDRRELARGLYDEFVEIHPELADAEERFNAGEIVIEGQAERSAEAPEGGRSRRRGRGRGRKPEGQEAAGEESGAVAVATDEPVPADAPADAPTEAPVEVAVGVADEAERPARRIRRSPVRRGG